MRPLLIFLAATFLSCACHADTTDGMSSFPVVLGIAPPDMTTPGATEVVVGY